MATWPPGEQTPSLDTAIGFRESFGLRADKDYVARSLVDPSSFPNMDWSVPLSPEETADMRARLAVQEQLPTAINYAGLQRGFGGAYIDQLRGGLPVFLFTDEAEGHREAIASFLPGVDFEIHQVAATLNELTALKNAVSASREWLRGEGISLGAVSVDVQHNRIEVEVARPTLVTRLRLARFGGPLVVVPATPMVLDTSAEDQP